MHELSVAIEILRAARREIAARGGGRLESVTVAVGELTGTEPDLLRYAWEAAAASEGEPQARLAVRFEPARCTCASCGPVETVETAETGRAGALGTWLRPCPRCGAPLAVAGGDALDIVELEFTETANDREEVAPCNAPR